MLELLRPDLYVESLNQIPLVDLRKRGIKGLIIDLDNTITEWNRDMVHPEITRWLSALPEHGIGVCLVSNNGEQRVNKVANSLGIACVFKAGKPRRRAFRQAMSLMGTKQDNTAVIGDQIFTDVLGGNRLGLYTILVVPLNRREFVGTRLVRQVERLVLKKLQHS